MKRFDLLCRFSVVAAVGLFLCVAPARATDPARQCRKDATSDRRDCTATCQSTYQDALALCGIPCVRQCGVTRKACRGPIQDQLAADIKHCNSTRTDEIKHCRQQAAADPSFDLDACIDAAQIAAFICRDDAKETAFPLLNQCNEEYHICVRACPS